MCADWNILAPLEAAKRAGTEGGMKSSTWQLAVLQFFGSDCALLYCRLLKNTIDFTLFSA
jgi:hypothetical protein